MTTKSPYHPSQEPPPPAAPTHICLVAHKYHPHDPTALFSCLSSQISFFFPPPFHLLLQVAGQWCHPLAFRQATQPSSRPTHLALPKHWVNCFVFLFSFR